MSAERGISAEMKAAVGADTVAPLLLFEADFPDGMVRLWNGLGEVTLDGETWYGAGELLEVEPASETVDGSAQNVSVTVSGFTPEVFDPVMLDGYQGRAARMLFAVADPETGEILGTPYVLFEGVMDSDEVNEGGESASIRITASNILADLLKVRVWRYTHEHQQRMFPGDDGLEFVAALQDLEIKWGKTA